MSLEDRVLKETQGDVINIMDPKNEELVEGLNQLVGNNLMLLSSIQTVASIEAPGWEPLVQHGSFMLGIGLRTRDTEIKLIMDAREHLELTVYRGDKVLQKLVIDSEPDSKLKS